MKRALIMVGVVLILLAIAAVLHPTYTTISNSKARRSARFRPRLTRKRRRKFPLPQPLRRSSQV